MGLRCLSNIMDGLLTILITLEGHIWWGIFDNIYPVLLLIFQQWMSVTLTWLTSEWKTSYCLVSRHWLDSRTYRWLHWSINTIWKLNLQSHLAVCCVSRHLQVQQLTICCCSVIQEPVLLFLRYTYALIMLAQWLSGSALDLQWLDREFDSHWGSLGKVVTPVCLCHQAV